jgi:two-component system, sensor histidine kinase and response regulator
VNGHEAVDTWKRERFDLILMDVQMPEMGGFEATAAIRSAEQGGATHIPIVATTARAMAGDRESCLEAGMDAYLAKPISAAELVTTIEGLVAGHPAIEADGVDSTEGSVVPEAGVVDRPALLERNAEHQDLLLEIAALFRAEAPQRIAAMTAALARGDAGALRSAAHTLRGSAGNFMAPETVDAALSLELAAGNGDSSLADGVLAALKRSVERLIGELGEMSVQR